MAAAVTLRIVHPVAIVTAVFGSDRALDDGAQWLLRVLQELHAADSPLLASTALVYYYAWRIDAAATTQTNEPFPVHLAALTCILLADKVTMPTGSVLGIHALRQAAQQVFALDQQQASTPVPLRDAIVAAERHLLEDVLRCRVVVDHPYKYIHELSKDWSTRGGLPASIVDALRDDAVAIVNDSYCLSLAILLFRPWTIAGAALLVAGERRACDMTLARADLDTRDVDVSRASDYLTPTFI